MSIDTSYLRRCIDALEQALEKMNSESATDDIGRDIYRAASVKEFELILEQGGKLLRKCLAAYSASNLEVDRLVFKDVFRHAAKHGLLDDKAAERWFDYRDTRNKTAHQYGKDYAEATLKQLPTFIVDARVLADAIETVNE